MKLKMITSDFETGELVLQIPKEVLKKLEFYPCELEVDLKPLIRKHPEQKSALDDLSNEFNSGLTEIYNNSGYFTLLEEISKRISQMKDRIILAWYAEYGFSPNSAELVEVNSDGMVRTYIRERKPVGQDLALDEIGKSNKPEEKDQACKTCGCETVVVQCASCGETRN